MEGTFEKSGSFVASQFRSPKEGHAALVGPAVTVSHQTGAGAHEVANLLVEILQAAEPKGAPSWSVLDRQLVEKALEEHHLPTGLAKKMPEDRRSYLDDILDDLFGLRPPSWVLVPQIVETMLHVAAAGHVVLIGRGATVVTARLPNVFHVRLTASLAVRIGRVQARHRMSIEEATRLVEKEDRGRRRYTRVNFHVRLENELLYHLVVNTDHLAFADAAAVIAEAATRYFRRSSDGTRPS
jgi:cytidylate kinase